VKNKVAPPFKEAEFDILYGVGISREGELVDLGTDRGIIEKSGAWYSYAGDRIGQGRENAKEFLHDHPEVADQIDRALRSQFGIGGGPREAVPEPEVKKAGKASS
jgi:recombination protein RecA